MTRSNAYSIFLILLRAAAVWLFCQAVFDLVEVRALPPESTTLGTAMAATMAVVAAVVWVFGDKLAKVVMARPNQPVFESDLSLAQWQMLAFSVLGLWQAVAGFADVTYFGARWFILRRMFHDYGSDDLIPDDVVAGLVSSVVQLVVGLGLLIGSGGLAVLLSRLRRAGLPSAADD